MGRLLGSGLSAHNSSMTIVVAALVVGTFLVGCLCLTIMYVRLKSKRRSMHRRVYEDGTTIPDGVLQVIVLAHNQEAELEVQLDGFETYEELRELVVDSVPQMFNDSDAILMEYADGSGFTRVKTKTPINVVKRARCVRMKCETDKLSKKIARRMPLTPSNPLGGISQPATLALHHSRALDLGRAQEGGEGRYWAELPCPQWLRARSAAQRRGVRQPKMCGVEQHLHAGVAVFRSTPARTLCSLRV